MQDLDLEAEAEAARMADLQAQGQAEEDEYAEDMAALQEVMGQPLPSTRGCVGWQPHCDGLPSAVVDWVLSLTLNWAVNAPEK